MVGRGLLAFALVACGSKDDPPRTVTPRANPVLVDAMTQPEPPPDAAPEKSIDDLPPEMRATLPTHSLHTTEELLQYVWARMTADRAVSRRLGAAPVIAAVTVTKVDVVDHTPSPAFVADPTLRDLAPDGPGGRLLFVNLVEGTVTKWLRGSGGKVVKGVWPAPQEASSADASVPAVGTRGLLVLRPHAKTVLGKELAAAVRGSLAIEPVEPVVIPDDGSIAQALAKPTSRAQLDKRLGELHGVALQVLLTSLVAAKPKDAPAALEARIKAGADDLDTLLVRAALLQLGARDAAIAGYDTSTSEADVLESINIVVLVHQGKRVGLTGAPMTTPIE